MNRNRDFRGPRGRGGRDDFGNDRRSFGDQPQPGWGEAPAMAPRAPIASGPPQDATVKWFNPEKGFGFVEMADGSGDAFLHMRVVETAGQTEMQPGTKLVIRTAQGQKGPQVTEILEVDASTAEAGAAARFGGPPRSLRRRRRSVAAAADGFGDRRPPRSGGFGDRDPRRRGQAAAAVRASAARPPRSSPAPSNGTIPPRASASSPSRTAARTCSSTARR